MTIIEDAVRKLEEARAARRPGESEFVPVGKLIDRADELPQEHESAAAEPSRGPDVWRTGVLPRGEGEPSADEPARRSQRTVAIDRDALRTAGLMAPEDEERRLVDEYRNIKRPIVGHALGKRATKVEGGRLILVTSALAGEGKTFTCINLALSIARERDLSVVLVDADVAKPHISRLFGVENEPGLLDVLDDPEAYDYKDLVIETDMPGLGLLPAGRPRSHATELLSSDRMEVLLKAYRKDDIQRLVLLDSPPLLQTPEARVLAGLAGQIALVVRAGMTPRHAVLDAIGTLDESKAVNLILNQARHSRGGAYYGGYHGYGGSGRSSAGDPEA